MKRWFAFLAMVASLSASLAAAEDSKVAPESNPTRGTFVIDGLHCPPCTRTVETALARTKGIQKVKVDWQTKNAWVTFDEQAISAQQVAQAIAATPHMMGGNLRYGGSLVLKVAGLKDDATIKTAKDALSGVTGVSAVYAYPKQQAVAVRFDAGGQVTTQQLIDSLDKAGLKASEYK